MMTFRRRAFIWQDIAKLVFSFFLLALMNQVLFAQDSVEIGREALSSRKYPWYDAESDGIKRVEFRGRPNAESLNRNEIPLAPLTQKKNVKAPANNWSGFFGGLSYAVWTLIGMGLLLILGLLVWAFLRMESDAFEDDAVSGRSMEESIKQLPFELEAKTGDFRQLAQLNYAEGNYRKAIIYLFSHVLVSLDQKSLIRLRKGKTNRQYLRELRRHRELSDYYQRVMVPFEATFFGEHELGKEEFENCWSRLDQFQSGVQEVQVVDA